MNPNYIAVLKAAIKILHNVFTDGLLPLKKIHSVAQILIFLISVGQMSAQQMQYGCDLDIICHNYYNTSHTGVFIPNPPGSSCNQADMCSNTTLIDIPPIYPFIALDEFISISVFPNDEIYFAIVSEDFEQCLAEGWWCENDNSQIETNELIIGEVYYIVFTPCGIGGVTEFELVIDDQEIDAIELVLDLEVSLIEECGSPFNPEHSYCPGTGFKIHPILNPEISTAMFEGTQWVLEINPEGLGDIIQVNYPFEYFEYYSEFIGLHAVELIGISGMELCTELGFTYRTLLEHAFIIGDEELVDMGAFSICETNLQFGFTPPAPWSGEDIFEEGVYYNISSHECECDVLQKVTVNQIDLTPGEMTLELCPQELPYHLNDDIIINAGDDLNGNYYEIEGASLQEDYNQEFCDSLIQLFVTFVDVQNTCNQCALAYSVKLDNLVACIPFDNSELDVSLHDNHSELQNGTEFFEDRFGNPDFATNLDGIDDFIIIAHSEKFLDDQYSFSFWFNKSENSFSDTNPKEALIYKGLEGNNKSFSITLEEHFIDHMLLTFSINSGAFEKQIQYGSLEYDRWYHIAVINDFGNLKLIIDGQLAESNNGNVSPKFNSEDILLGVIPSNNGFDGFFKGQLDEFRFWTRSLSDREAYLLFRPEAEFHMTSEYFLSCCESTEFHGQTYNTDTSADTVRIIGASPTGKDSLYIINITATDSAPVILEEFIPDDIFIKVSNSCDDPCETIVEWTDPPVDAFLDNCSDLTITQSHFSPLLITDEENEIEVTYTATDACGQSTVAFFKIFLECKNTSSPEIPVPTQIVPFAENLCIGEQTSVCRGTEVNWTLLHNDEATQLPTVYHQNLIADWYFTLSTPDGMDTLTYLQSSVPSIDYIPASDGEYILCLHAISNFCHQVERKVCQTIFVTAPADIDHGAINICKSEIPDLPYNYPELSPELIAMITTMPFGESQTVEREDDCGCFYNETATIHLVNDFQPEPVHLEICESDLPYDYNGIQILEGDSYFNTHFTLPQNSVYSNDLGIHCDSSILLTTSIIPTISSYNEISICEGEEFHGLSEEGYYEFMDISSTGCDSISIIELLVLPPDDIDCQSTSIQNIDPSKISVYPNPASDLLVVRLDSPGQEDMRYQLISINGKIIQQGVISKRIYPIEIKNMESGVYILLLQRDTDLVTLRTIVIE